jgi:hypothetical protein
MANLPSAWLWVVGLFAPLIASVLLKKNWDGRIKQLIAFSLAVGLAFLVMWIDGTLSKVIAAGNLPMILGAILGEAEVAFKQVWEPYLLTTPVEKKATTDLKEMLYVEKAVPIIEAGKSLVTGDDKATG